MEEEPRDHGVEAAALQGDLLGLRRRPLVAGGEDGGHVRRSEPFALRPPSPRRSRRRAGQDSGSSGPPPGSARPPGGPGSTPRPPPSRRRERTPGPASATPPAQGSPGGEGHRACGSTPPARVRGAVPDAPSAPASAIRPALALAAAPLSARARCATRPCSPASSPY